MNPLVVVGGCGHVGLPLAMVLADKGLTVTAYDTDADRVATVKAGLMPFGEKGGDSLLFRLAHTGRFDATTDPLCITEAAQLIITTGQDIGPVLPYLRDGQLLVIRNTMAPGGVREAEYQIEAAGLDVDVAFAPERIMQHQSLMELATLPQIISARTDRAMSRAKALFGMLAVPLVVLDVEEAELAKLFANTWRYIQFAAANEFWMIATEAGLDYEKIRAGLMMGYPRALGLPAAGFAGGPCLPKDAALLWTSSANADLARAAADVNHGLPIFLAGLIEAEHDLSRMTVGVLGVAFKPGSDDLRGSVSMELYRYLQNRAARVMATDPYIQADWLYPLEKVREQAELLIVATPHREYDDIEAIRI